MSQDRYKDAGLYILDVRSFYDSNGDGIGDFRGLTQKLDYVADLGATILVLLPFYATAGQSGGFDIVDHRALDPNTGHLREFRSFLRAAHQYPVIGTQPYSLDLPPFGFSWFHLVGAVSFRSCFISYSSADQEFANRLYDDLRSREVQCWIAVRDLATGDHFREMIAERIRSSERVIVICSENSFRSEEVALEVALAGAEEMRRTSGQTPSNEARVILPLRIDAAFKHTDVPWFVELRNTRHIADFEQWRDSTAYDQALRRLARDLARPQENP